MAIPTSMSSGGSVVRRTGVRVAAFPSDPTFGMEIQCSSSTAYPSSRTALRRMAPTAANFVIATFETPYSTRRYFARARHYKIGYSTGAWTNLGSDLPGYLVDGMPDVHKLATRISSLQNLQGSILPVPFDATVISFALGGGTNGHMFANMSTSAAYTLRRPDGSTVTAPATNTYDRPAAPTLGQVASGALGPRTLFARVAMVKRNPQNNATVMYRTSAESSLAVSANNVLKITSPPAVTGYDGWVALIGTATGTEVIQERGGGGGATDDGIIPFGTDFAAAEVTTSTTRTPYDPSMDNGFTITERAASPTVYKGYLYFDQSVGTGGVYRIAAGTNGNWITTNDDVAASEQMRDTVISLSFGPTVSMSMPVAGGTGSGFGSGNKLR